MDTSSGTSSKKWVCVGAFAGAHGIRGDVHIKFFTEEPWKVERFPEMWNESGSQSYHLSQVRGVKSDMLVASFKEIQTREAAAALKGKRLYVSRESLPDLPEEESYYQVDLIGCEVYTLQGEFFGKVKGFQNFGAGDIVEIALTSGGGSIYVSFSKQAIPEINFSQRRLTLDTAFVLDPKKEEE